MTSREPNAKKHKRIIIVPPRGANIRSVRVKRTFLVVLIIVILFGIAGYFVPFSNLSLDVVEQQHKNILDEQNKRITADVKSMRKNLGALNDEMKTLERKKKEIAEISGMNDSAGHSGIIRKHSRRLHNNIDTLYGVTVRAYNLFSALMKPVSQTTGASTVFDKVPVSRPVCGVPFVLARFGIKKDPFTDGEKMHYGVDFVIPENAPVVATAAGKVILVDHTAMWGYRVVIRHAYGFTSVYAHLGSPAVRSGDAVIRGKRVGIAGLSGLTTGVHVHYELLLNGKNVDPELYFFPDWAQTKL